MNANPMTERDLNGKWIDFYALLGVDADVDKETLRKTIGQTYADASANCDHRDLQRRHYFQTMVERVLPQCRRVLLDPTMRAAYDEQNALHRAGDSRALDYVSFMTALQSGGVVKNPGGEFDGLPEKLQDEINLARAVIECVETGSEFEFLPAMAVTKGDGIAAAPTNTSALMAEAVAAPVTPAPLPPKPRPVAPPVEDTTYFVNTPIQQTAEPSRVAEARNVQPPPAVPEPVAPATEARRARPAEPRAQVKEVIITGDGRTLRDRQESAASKAIADDGSFGGGSKTKAKVDTTYKPRVVVEDEDAWQHRRDNKRKADSKSLLSPLATHLLTGIVSALLIFTILHFTDNNSAAPAGPRVPVTVAYALELRPVMEAAKQQFEASEQGANVELVLQPIESRDGMNRLLASGNDNTRPDVWIPSESVWSNRYNQVAPQRGRRTIVQAQPLALSPLVLVARSDKSAILRAKFPNRKISSWAALRTLVPRQAPNHFGLSNPERAGSGALVRSFMAREWATSQGLPWNINTTRDPRLWAWMSAFESNVPDYKMTGEMVRDMALGTTGSYWWCLAYESDAIYWMGQGKNLEIYYLPGTHYADYPYCHIDRGGSNRQISIASTRFEQFLRSQPVQLVMLQNGFRPLEIALNADVPNNPFKAQGYSARGVRPDGVQAAGRPDYRTVNNLTAQWAQRFSS
jgi:hypothetical protein